LDHGYVGQPGSETLGVVTGGGEEVVNVSTREEDYLGALIRREKKE